MYLKLYKCANLHSGPGHIAKERLGKTGFTGIFSKNKQEVCATRYNVLVRVIQSLWHDLAMMENLRLSRMQLAWQGIFARLQGPIMAR